MRKLGVLFITLLCLTACDKKGDGSHFYAERIYKNKDFVYFTHHSTLDCPEIKEGVRRDGYYHERILNHFCSKCMDDSLINKWYKWYERKEAERNK